MPGEIDKATLLLLAVVQQVAVILGLLAEIEQFLEQKSKQTSRNRSVRGG